MEKSKEDKKKPKNWHWKPSQKWLDNNKEVGLGDNPSLQRASTKHPSSWSRGRIRHMQIPGFVYILVDKRTGEAYKTKNREMPFYTTMNGIKVSLRNISAYRDISDFKIVQYELVERVVIDG